jgi:hypothetical protein
MHNSRSVKIAVFSIFPDIKRAIIPNKQNPHHGGFCLFEHYVYLNIVFKQVLKPDAYSRIPQLMPQVLQHE